MTISELLFAFLPASAPGTSTYTFVISFVIVSADAETAVPRITEITTTSAMVNAKILFAFIFFLLFIFSDNRRGDGPGGA